MRNLQITTRMLVLVAVMAIALLGVGLGGLLGLARGNDALRTVFEDRTVPMQQLAQIQAKLLRNRLLVNGSLIDNANVDSFTKRIDENIADITALWKAYMATKLTDEEVQLSRRFQEDRTRFVEQGLRPAVQALRNHDLDGARALATGKMRELYEPTEQGINALYDLQVRVAKQEYEQAQQRYVLIRNASVGAVAGSVAFALWLGLSLARNVSRSLRQAVAVAEAVAAGDLTCRVEAQGRDELGRLLQALEAMRRQLSSMVAAVRSSAEQVASASTQIANGNVDLSARTEEQASALEQTASAMQQLSSTVSHTAENAGKVNALAHDSSQLAASSGDVVGAVVSTMGRISDSAERIREIITVIDGIAFQTNILALNAAVEAARAGEHGRGFAVVASEVRALAHRSADAAREVKTLISDSVERVQEGSSLVEQARTQMAMLTESVKNVSALVDQITTAAREQSTGVGQVGEAIAQMDKTTQQNAALVEEAAAAAESLKEQAGALVGAVATFRVA